MRYQSFADAQSNQESKREQFTVSDSRSSSKEKTTDSLIVTAKKASVSIKIDDVNRTDKSDDQPFFGGEVMTQQESSSFFVKQTVMAENSKSQMKSPDS